MEDDIECLLQKEDVIKVYTVHYCPLNQTSIFQMDLQHISPLLYVPSMKLYLEVLNKAVITYIYMCLWWTQVEEFMYVKVFGLTIVLYRWL